jgi:tetratricopeptide (TPR) repeat protein
MVEYHDKLLIPQVFIKTNQLLFNMIRTELYYDFRDIESEDYTEKIKFYEKYSSILENSENFENLDSRIEFIRRIHIIYQCGSAYIKYDNYKKAIIIFEFIIQLIESNHKKYNIDLLQEYYYRNSIFLNAQVLYYLKKYSEAEKKLKIIQDAGYITYSQTSWYVYAKYAIFLKSINYLVLISSFYLLLVNHLIFSLPRFVNLGVCLAGVALMILFFYDPSKWIARFLKKIYFKKRDQKIEKRIDLITYYTQKIEENPNDYVSLVERGIEYNLDDDFEKSLTDLNAALMLNPINIDGLYYRAICLKNLQLYDQAIVDCTKLIALRYSNLAEIYNDRAIIYRELDKFELALKDQNKAIELEPYVALYLFNRAYLYQINDSIKEAIKDYDLVLLYEPENIIAMTNRGEAHYALGNKEMAFADFTKAKESGYQEAIDNLNKLEF